MSASESPSSSELSIADRVRTWTESAWLGDADFDLIVPEISSAVEYQESMKIERHRFFDIAAHSRDALRLWAEQEFIVSSAFSQELAKWISRIDNCNIRTMVIPVFVGEHHELQGGRANSCHPLLARRLAVSLGTATDCVIPLRCTLEFLEAMEESALGGLSGAGFLGVGNERMLVPEYTAVRKAFMAGWPEADFDPFLDANIADDRIHHELIERAAAGMVSLGGDARDFLEFTRKGVDARIAYYDDLCRVVEDPERLLSALAPIRADG